jgi:glycosyltransferase involved in cell wall biosynthesis
VTDSQDNATVQTPALETAPEVRRPLVSIGIPVLNGQRFLRDALESLLAQTLTDIEIIVCDNNSADATGAIAQEYVARDSRVRYFKNASDLGPAANHNLCFSHATGKYFKWHAHDDYCAPTFLEKCVAVLERDPSIANCHTLTRIVDEQGKFLRNYEFRTDTDSPVASRRFGKLISVSHRQHVGYEIFGVWRRAQLAETPLEKADAHGDRILLVRMSLRGRFYEVPETLFFARAHAKQSMNVHPRRGRLTRWIGTGPLPPAEWWDESKKGKIVFPEWNLLAEYWASISEVPTLSFWNRLRCRLWVGVWILLNWYKLVRDLVLALEHTIIQGSSGASDTPPAARPPNVSKPHETALARG